LYPAKILDLSVKPFFSWTAYLPRIKHSRQSRYI